MKAHFYLAFSACKRIQETPKLHLLSMFTIMICFFIVGAGLMTFHQIKRSLHQTSQQQWVHVYFQVDFEERKQEQVKKTFCKDPWVDACRFVDQNQAQAQFLSQYPEMQKSLDALGENPLPPSLEIRLKQKIEDKHALQEWLNKIRQNNHVLEVDDGGKWLSQWIDLIHFFERFTYVLVLFVGLMIVGLVSNTITLLMYSKKDEIGILQLVGATPMMIRLPLLLSAGLYGLIGSLLALGLLYFSYQGLIKYLSTYYSALLPEGLKFMSLFDQVLLVFVAVLVSVLGAWIATQSYLSKRDIS